MTMPTGFWDDNDLVTANRLRLSLPQRGASTEFPDADGVHGYEVDNMGTVTQIWYKFRNAAGAIETYTITP